MAATRPRRGGWLPVLLLAGLFVLTLGRGAAWPELHGGHGGGRVGGFSGGDRLGMGVPLGDFGNRRFAVGRFHGRPVGRGRHHGQAFFPYYSDGPYYDVYGADDDEEDTAPDSRERPPARSQHSGYCDVSARTYPQYCVWKPGP